MIIRKFFKHILSISLAGLVTYSIGLYADTESPSHLNVNGSNWMSALPDTWSISEFSIPGTHDSAARDYNDPLTPDSSVLTQTMTISEQLNAGVRFLDIRCRHIINSCALHHGRVYLLMNLNDALGQVYTFLDANRSETVIVSIKTGEHDDSGNTQSFEETLRTYIEAKKEYWYTDSVIPKLGIKGDPSSVRGKAILFRRFGIEAWKTYGINASDWPDNTTFSIPSSWTPKILSVQDYYDMGAYVEGFKPDRYPNKWDSISKQLTAASKDTSLWYINFTSGVVFTYIPFFPNVPNIPLVSNYINPRVSDFFTSKSGHFGTIVMDFMTPEIAHKIYTSTLSRLAATDSDLDGVTTAQEIATGTDPFTSIRIEGYGYDIRIPWKRSLNSPIQITADTNPTSFKVKGLPKGLKLDNLTGAISGTPEQSGRFKLFLEAKNQEGRAVTTSWDLRVEELPNSRYAESLNFKINQRVNILPRAVTPKSWPTYSVVSGALPDGLYLDTRTGAIRGHLKLSSAGNYPFTIRAENSAGSSESSMTIKITR